MVNVSFRQFVSEETQRYGGLHDHDGYRLGHGIGCRRNAVVSVHNKERKRLYNSLPSSNITNAVATHIVVAPLSFVGMIRDPIVAALQLELRHIV